MGSAACYMRNPQTVLLHLLHRVWVNGEEYPVEEASGEAIIPFAASPSGMQAAVLIAADDFAALETIDISSETYSLAAGATSCCILIGLCTFVEHLTPGVWAVAWCVPTMVHSLHSKGSRAVTCRLLGRQRSAAARSSSTAAGVGCPARAGRWQPPHAAAAGSLRIDAEQDWLQSVPTVCNFAAF